MGSILVKNLVTISKSYAHTDAVKSEDLGFFVTALGIRNDTDKDIIVNLSKYTDDILNVASGTYVEVAVTTNYYNLDFNSGTGSVVVTYVKNPTFDALMAPFFPNLVEMADEDGDSTDDEFYLNPINAYGYTYTPWAASNGLSSVGEGIGTAPTIETPLVEIEYYVDGVATSQINSTNFYQNLFNMIATQLAASYPTGYTPPGNPEFSPVIADEVQERIKQLISGADSTLNDEFYGGYINGINYDDANRSFTVVLDTTGEDSIVVPWVSLGAEVKVTTSPLADMKVTFKLAYEDGLKEGSGLDDVDPAGEEIEVTLNAGNNYTFMLSRPAREFWISDGAGTVEITFNGAYAALLPFAPILNVVYPLGMTNDGGTPNEAYLSFQQKVESLKVNLQAARFTGRVLYFRAIPFVAQPHEVYTADVMIRELAEEPLRYVWAEIADQVPNYYQFSRLEKDILGPIITENYSYYYGGPNALPTTLEDVINNNSVTVRGLTTATEKKAFLVKLLLEEYNGSYSLGGMSVMHPGLDNNRVN